MNYDFPMCMDLAKGSSFTQTPLFDSRLLVPFYCCEWIFSGWDPQQSQWRQWKIPSFFLLVTNAWIYHFQYRTDLKMATQIVRFALVDSVLSFWAIFCCVFLVLKSQSITKPMTKLEISHRNLPQILEKFDSDKHNHSLFSRRFSLATLWAHCIACCTACPKQEGKHCF